MRSSGRLLLLLLLGSLCGCATQPPRFRSEALASLQRVRKGGAPGAFSAELGSAEAVFDQGESLLKEDESEAAERYFFLTFQKGTLLEGEIARERVRIREALRRAKDAERAELKRRAQEEALRLALARAEAEAKAEAEALARKEKAEVERKKNRPVVREHLLVSTYTVKRGESLPLIASQSEVYGDRNLWPLLYRANRDQISDPRHIWPGQVLRIPRTLGRDDILEARRYALERPLH